MIQNKLLLAVFAALSAATAANAQLSYYDLNNTNPGINTPTFCDTCISATDINRNSINFSLVTPGANGSGNARCVTSWSTAADNSSWLNNVSFSSVPTDTIYFNNTFNAAAGTDAYVGDLTLAYKQIDFNGGGIGANSSIPDVLQAMIVWQENGVTKYRYSNQITPTGTSWNNAAFNWSAGGNAALPTGTALAGKTFQVRLFGWGAGTDTNDARLAIDEICLLGKCGTGGNVPEPTGALLVGSSLGMLALRRRRK